MAVQAQIFSGGSQSLMENVFGLNEHCFNLPARQQKPPNPCFGSTWLLPRSNSHQPLAFPTQIEREGQEIDRLIFSQNEILRLALEEQRRQTIQLLLETCESNAVALLNQKDEEIATAMARTTELEGLVKILEVENQAWQRAAIENEAMVVSIRCSIKRLMESSCLASGAEDARSCCGESEQNKGGEEGDSEERARERKRVCKICGSRGSRVLLLPCRHLCSCEACQGSLSSCPVCGVAKKASIEVLV